MPHGLPSLVELKRIASSTRGGAAGSHAPMRRMIPVFRRLFSDVLTPVLAYRRLVRPDSRMAPSFLFESVVGGDSIGRYSFLGAWPVARLIARGNRVTFEDFRQPAASFNREDEDPLATLADLSRSFQLEPMPGLPAFTGGWVGYASYDTVRYLEPEKLSKGPNDDRGLPDIDMQLYRDLVTFDHVQKTVLVITHIEIDDDVDDAALEARYAKASERLDQAVQLLVTASSHENSEAFTGHVDLAAAPPELGPSNLGEGGYQRAVEACKQYIAAGDAFQIVPSQRFEVTTPSDPFDVYRALRVINPSPYMAYLQIDGGMLVASSPEILCKVEDGVVTNRPLAGTRKRGATEEQDAAMAHDLLEDPKDRAEHIMLVDLGRNDVGVVAQPGTIKLPQLLAIERYSHVMHLSSTVTGKLRAGLSSWDALRAILPVGTVSGAPKVRAMQIIDELETVRRGPYAGALGYVDFAGNMDMAIALRTMVVMPGEEAGTWKVHIQAGAGIVADSDPQLEHEETVNKAAALARAVELAKQSF